MSKIDKTGHRKYFEEFCKRLYAPCNAFKVVRSNAIEIVSSTDKQLMESILGLLGVRMHDFFSGLDLNHPCINQAYDGIFLDDNEFAIFLCEILSCGKHLVKKGYTRALSLVSQHAASHLSKLSKQTDIIDMPERNRCNVRLVLDRSRRDKIRIQKKPQIIDMCATLKKGVGFFESHPDCFARYMRYDTQISEELVRMESKAIRYEEIGCSVLADEIRKNLSTYNEHVKQTYYGFNRTTISSIATTMAKSIGCVPADIGGKDGLVLRVSNDVLGKPHGDSFFSYIYEPIIYPIHYFESIMPATVKSVLEHLDKFPDTDGKPLFDFFGVVVPSVRLPMVEDRFGYRDSMGNTVDFESYNDCKHSFDKWLVSEGLISPVIVAEKDHKCYFLTYWV